MNGPGAGYGPDMPDPDPDAPDPHHTPTEGERKLQHGTVDGGDDTARTADNGEIVPRPGTDAAELEHAVRETPVHPADEPDPAQ